MVSFLSRNYQSLLDHDLIASIREKAILILVGNLNSGRSYLITAVPKIEIHLIYFVDKNTQNQPL